MNWSKHLRELSLLAICFVSLASFGQMEIQRGIEGKTFFDTARTEVHEAYEYKLRYTMIINPRTGDAEPNGTPEELKNGLYIKYRRDGTIYCTGYYRNDVKCGEWKYMDPTGSVTIKTEIIKGECVVKE
jgi:hypothetical protein